MVKRRRTPPLERVSHRITIDEGMDPLWDWLKSRKPGTHARELAEAARVGVRFLLGQVPAAALAAAPVSAPSSSEGHVGLEQEPKAGTRWEAGDFEVPAHIGSSAH